MFPATFRAFAKQRIRWSRNSYRCYLTAVWKGWLWRVPLVTKVTVLQILLTPVTMGITIGYMVFSRLEPDLAEHPPGRRLADDRPRHPRNLAPAQASAEILLLPLVTLTVILIALPIKLYAFVTMNKQGWLTRSDDHDRRRGPGRGLAAPARTQVQAHVRPAPAASRPQHARTPDRETEPVS